MMAAPKIRFKGFAGDWEQRKLGEVVSVFDGTHQTPNYIKSGIMFLSVENINTLQSEKFISEEDFDKEFKIFPEYGDILMTRIGDIGTANVVRSNNKIAYYVSLALMKSQQVDSDFLVAAISSENMQLEIWKRTLHVAFPKKINKNEIDKLNIVIPQKDEQQKIGNFFRTLDDTITLHKRKLDGLKELKKGYLQQMFPRTGDSVPRVRFAGFSGDWKTRKLGEVFEQTAKFVNPKEDDIELWSLTVENGLTPKTERYNREFLVKKDDSYKSVAPYEFVYNPMNMTLGAVDLNLLNKNVAISGYYITMRANEDYDNNYFAIWLKSASAIELYKIYATGGLIEKQRVQFPTLSQIMTLVPSKAEQTAIGSFFSNLDEQIAAQQTKLDKLKQLKAAYLQRMFV